ncbi:tryptophan transporter TrpP [Halanaerobium saccharolyticum]|uniref:Tryptophan transporter TrpP n=1 Tax=Halanaerobium saccharolyticum TaxID=43595 RepID=A0A4V3G448_9FIRM|nr:tryptophan transporter [Halanaerobium saccharolyticum]RAK08927.1 tryptophan transporter TrpP [Halanaerobium saccharolyticum]TDV98967.1 tryptophan transporter TrpP [Halanaerobium saccharolyticum]TDX60690.1 tryptophan transporter TrpP [Halanaerobium saccharolyticum]
MRTKDLAQASLLVAIAMILRSLTPPIFLGMKPDLTLTMMFIILIVKRDIKLGFLVALATAIFTALTTTFPGGQIANIVDKLLTFVIVYNLISVFNKFMQRKTLAGVTTAVGTIISGSIFLTIASMLVDLPAPFSALFISVVLPAAVVNTIAAVILFSVVDFAIDVEYNQVENETL